MLEVSCLKRHIDERQLFKIFVYYVYHFLTMKYFNFNYSVIAKNNCANLQVQVLYFISNCIKFYCTLS